MNVSIEMYKFLKNKKCHTYGHKKTHYVILSFHEIEELTYILGYSYFDDGGEESITLFQDYVAVELENIFEYLDLDFKDFKDLFSE